MVNLNFDILLILFLDVNKTIISQSFGGKSVPTNGFFTSSASATSLQCIRSQDLNFYQRDQGAISGLSVSMFLGAPGFGRSISDTTETVES